jgi:hypothetical protein
LLNAENSATSGVVQHLTHENPQYTNPILPAGRQVEQWDLLFVIYHAWWNQHSDLTFI